MGRVSVALYHRLRSITSERLDRMHEGSVILIVLRLAGLEMLAGIVAYLVSPQGMAWAAVRLPDWLRWTGAGLLGLCAFAPYLDAAIARQESHRHRGDRSIPW